MRRDRIKVGRSSITVLIIGSVVWGAALLWHPSTAEIPRLPVPTVSPRQTVTWPVPSTPAPIPRPERSPEKPTNTSLTFYVVSRNVPSYWGIDAVIAGWKSARYSDFKTAAVCPVASPCITIMVTTLGSDTAAQAEFGYRMQDLYIKLNPIVKSHNEAQSALAHEFGHILGAPHIIGTHNTVMNPIGVYRLLPTKLDIQTVDRLGRWQLEKMYENSGKTVAVHAVPN